MLRFLCVLPLMMLSDCASIVTGFDQTMTVSTTPPGASCIVERLGTRISAIPATPGIVSVEKSGADLSVICTKDGFQPTLFMLSSGFNGATLGNIIAGGVVGFVVDAVSGANFNYPGHVTLDLIAMPAARTAPVATVPALGLGVDVLTADQAARPGRSARQGASRS